MNRTDALATIAYCILSTRGLTDNPTLHDIMLAVVQAAPLLDVTGDPHATRIELRAADMLIRRHKWNVGAVVLLTPRPNGYQRKHATNDHRRQTTNGSPAG